MPKCDEIYNLTRCIGVLEGIAVSLACDSKMDPIVDELTCVVGVLIKLADPLVTLERRYNGKAESQDR